MNNLIRVRFGTSSKTGRAYYFVADEAQAELIHRDDVGWSLSDVVCESPAELRQMRQFFTRAGFYEAYEQKEER